MSADSHPGAGPLRRDRSAGWLGGVCAGIARRYGVDPALVRLAFVVATAAGGFGIALYALGWLVIPAGEARPARAAGCRPAAAPSRWRSAPACCC